VNFPGRFAGYTPDGEGIFLAKVDDESKRLIDRREITECEVLLRDGRTLTVRQSNTIHALVGDITAYISAPLPAAWRRAATETLRELELLFVFDKTDKEEVRRAVTRNFCRASDIELFSLSPKSGNCADMTTANEFIAYLLELCVTHGIPCSEELIKRAEDVGRYLYACVANRRCCICGQKADIHEVDFVGMGRNRRKMHHLGQRVQPLCRGHHGERGQIGQAAFDRRYHLDSVRLDEHLCRTLGWKI
jgi:hypothetical protein